MSVLVTGACGWIGKKICSFLSRQRIEVVGSDIYQRANTEDQWSKYLQLDITKPVDVNIPKVDAVIHCAGIAHRPNETLEDRKLFYSVNRNGTQHMLDWCERNGVRRFLYVSSIAFYDWWFQGAEVGDRLSNVRDPSSVNHHSPNAMAVTEDHPVVLPTHYAKSKYDGEQLVIQSSLDWQVVRLATVFGEGDKANFARMAVAMKKHMFAVPGDGSACKSVIPVSLAAGLIAEFALMAHPPHRLINIGLPAAPSLSEIVEAYHSICGFPKCPRIPMPLAKGLGKCGDLAKKVLGRFPFTSNTLSKLTTSTQVSVDRMLECFPNHKFESFAFYLKECAHYYSAL